MEVKEGSGVGEGRVVCRECLGSSARSRLDLSSTQQAWCGHPSLPSEQKWTLALRASLEQGRGCEWATLLRISKVTLFFSGLGQGVKELNRLK